VLFRSAIITLCLIIVCLVVYFTAFYKKNEKPNEEPNEEPKGVSQIVAGTGVTINPKDGKDIVTLNIATIPLPSGESIDIKGLDIAITAKQLQHCYIYSSITLTGKNYKISLPNYSDLLATYGTNAVIPFTIGNMKALPPCQIVLQGDSSTFIVSNFNLNQQQVNGLFPLVRNLPLNGQQGYVIIPYVIWEGKVVLDSINSIAYYTLSYLTNVAF
jgi:hypothetical protein